MEQDIKFLDAYKRMEIWLSKPDLSPKLKRELEGLEKRLEANSGDREAKEEIYDRFYKDLDFGTGGLRGILGAGTNRINIYTVRRVSQGFADYINEKYSGGNKIPDVAIAYDSRILSDRFALEAAGVMVANGIKVYLYSELMPTPALSYAVRYFNCCGGIMITASHNPAGYNGYKVYNSQGSQVTSQEASRILDRVRKIDIFEGVKTSDIDWDRYMDGVADCNIDFINFIPEKVIDSYIAAVKDTRVGINCDNLEVVYTPLNGTGNKPVRRILKEIGVNKLHIVQEQEKPDGNFPTCPYPNPEKEEALLKGLILCQTLKTPDLLLATDPDCDRLGVAVKVKESYKTLTGNEIGILLLDFICSNKPLPDKPVAMKTIVSSKLADLICGHYNVELITLLTGFKYIGEQIGILEHKKEEHRFIFAFEESYGYLSGSYVRDKDAVNAAMLICEAASFYKKQGKTLIQRMSEIYDQYGYYTNSLVETVFEGAKGTELMNSIISGLRSEPPMNISGYKVVEIADYLKSKRFMFRENCSGSFPMDLPGSDVMEFVLSNGSSVIVRASGTEPKLKIYLSVRGSTKQQALEQVDSLKTEIKGWLNQWKKQ